MNEANQFYEEMRSRRQAMEDGSVSSATPSESGNGEGPREGAGTTTTDGTPSQAGTDLSLTPNG